MRTIHITEGDREALLRKLKKASGQEPHLESLRQDLESATVVEPAAYPKDMVTVNSAVHLVDRDTGEKVICILVLPQDADADMNMVSALTPLGSALLGRRVRETVEWPTARRTKRLEVAAMIYQVASSRFVLPVMNSARSRSYLMEK